MPWKKLERDFACKNLSAKIRLNLPICGHTLLQTLTKYFFATPNQENFAHSSN